jgi:hypothetical protein
MVSLADQSLEIFIDRGNQSKGAQKMKRPGIVICMIVCILSCLVVSQKPCHAANWLSVAYSTDKLREYYIDTDSIQVDKSKSTIRAWIKVTHLDDGEKLVTLDQFNYKERYCQGLELTIYTPDGKSKTTDYPDKIIYIQPDTVMEIIFNKLLEIKGLK